MRATDAGDSSFFFRQAAREVRASVHGEPDPFPLTPAAGGPYRQTCSKMHQTDIAMLTLRWHNPGDGAFGYSLEGLDLSRIRTTGVYIIWHEGQPGHAIRVGHGDIAKSLSEHRGDPAVLAYRAKGQLRVIWATAPLKDLAGIEAHLIGQWRPLLGPADASTAPIKVETPFIYPPAINPVGTAARIASKILPARAYKTLQAARRGALARS